MSSFTVRPATEADRESFVRIWRDAFGDIIARYDWDAAEERRKGDEEFDEGEVALVEIDGRAVGYLSTQRAVDHHFICGIAVVRQMQRKSIGTALLQQAQEEARQSRVPLRLSVFDDNPARELYSRLGFRELRLEPPRVIMEWLA